VQHTNVTDTELDMLLVAELPCLADSVTLTVRLFRAGAGAPDRSLSGFPVAQHLVREAVTHICQFVMYVVM